MQPIIIDFQPDFVEDSLERAAAELVEKAKAKGTSGVSMDMHPACQSAAKLPVEHCLEAQGE